MPELAPDRRRYVPRTDLRGDVPAARYAELHCKTNFSFLEGASHPEELVERAAELGYRALAVTDRNSFAGVVRAHVAAKEVGLRLIVGTEVTPRDFPSLLLLPTDRKAYGRLCRLLTIGRRRAEKGSCDLAFADIAELAEGSLGLVIPPRRIPAENGEPLAQSLQQLRAVFGDRGYCLAERLCGPEDDQHLRRLLQQAQQTQVPLVAANDVHYHIPQRAALQDVLTAIRQKETVTAIREHLFANRQRHLKSPAEMADLFLDIPEIVPRTTVVTDRCHFSLEELRYEYPEELCPAGMTPLEHLVRLTWAGAKHRYASGIPDKVRQLLEHELTLIEELRYEAYFLTVWDLVRFARSRNILCQGRGSAANSVVCFCLGVTSVDPERIDVLFERFISKERNEAPDIDVDFEHERREEVLQYIYEKYGRDRAGMTAEVITYRPRSALRDVGKALGLSLDCVDKLAKSVDGYRDATGIEERFREAGFDPETKVGRQLRDLVEQILGFPRHLSQHVGGMVMTRGLLCELVPIENAAMPGRTVIEWDKNDLDSLGILKVDCLALGMLTALHRCFDFLERHYGRKLTLASVPAEDPAVYEMVSKADTIGVFQIESRAQMSMLPRLRPRCFYDLVIEVAIVRPGPIQGDMVHPYLRRRQGEEPIDFPSEAIRGVLEKTLGVPLFQEQAMRLAVVAAGFTPGEADQLRRAMGAWRRTGVMEQFYQKLVRGMEANGLSAEYADRLYRQIRGFGEYGFPESHAASFALLVYVSAWLKRYYPAAFCASLINSQPMGFYAPAQLVRDARSHGVEVRPTDINFSDWDCTLEPIAREEEVALRLGLRLISGLSEVHARVIEESRRGEPFQNLEDFRRRTRLPPAVVARLAKADAFASLQLGRRQALWNALAPKENLPLLADLDVPDEKDLQLPELLPEEEVVADYRTMKLSLRAHPFSFLREKLDVMKVVPASALLEYPERRPLKVAGLVLLRQQPSTAKGIRFVTLEDETGTINLVVRPDIWERYHRPANRATAFLVHGQVERKNEIIHVLTHRIEDLTPLLGGVRVPSRDFR